MDFLKNREGSFKRENPSSEETEELSPLLLLLHPRLGLRLPARRHADLALGLSAAQAQAQPAADPARPVQAQAQLAAGLSRVRVHVDGPAQPGVAGVDVNAAGRQLGEGEGTVEALEAGEGDEGAVAHLDLRNK